MNFCKHGLNVIEKEAQAIFKLAASLNTNFDNACELILNCKGRIVVTGMGKSGHIGNKIASTLASTGTPAFFMHPGEACHGDFGMITAQDLLLAISHSGHTNEILTLIPLIKRSNIPLISITGNPQSPLAKAANYNLDVSIDEEACPLNLAPTTSSTVTLVMGDALAIALLHARGFSEQDFALSHPGGTLGRRLILTVNDIWHIGEELPLVHESVLISEALIEVTDKKLGMTCIIDDAGFLSGVFTDGDVRRVLNKQINIHTTQIKEAMTKNPQTINPNELVKNALDKMRQLKITSLVIIENAKPIAVVHMHDILRVGII